MVNLDLIDFVATEATLNNLKFPVNYVTVDSIFKWSSRGWKERPAQSNSNV